MIDCIPLLVDIDSDMKSPVLVSSMLTVIIPKSYVKKRYSVLMEDE